MADIYVKSTAAGAANGSSWTDAFLTGAGAAAVDVAGDNIYFSQAHSETSTTAAISLPLAGTNGNPVKLLCVNDSAIPPTTPATGALIKTTGSNGINITGSGYVNGISFEAGSGSSAATLSLSTNASVGNIKQVYENCNLSLLGTSASSNRIAVGGTATSTNAIGAVDLFNCGIKSVSTVAPFAVYGNLYWEGGSILTGTNSTSLLTSSSTQAKAEIRNVDLSNLPSACNLVASGFTGKVDIIDCKLPASWSGSLSSATVTNIDARFSMYNCWYSSINYSLWIECWAGSIRDNATVVKTGGATDGTTALSWKMTSNTNPNELIEQLATDYLPVWIDAVGVSKTITLDFLHDSVTALTDADIWLEVGYLGSSTVPLGIFLSGKRSSILASGTAHTASSATWTTTGLTNPNAQKMSLTFTSQMKGWVYVRVLLAKPSYTVYLDYEVQES